MRPKPEKKLYVRHNCGCDKLCFCFLKKKFGKKSFFRLKCDGKGQAADWVSLPQGECRLLLPLRRRACRGEDSVVISRNDKKAANFLKLTQTGINRNK
jgi:hypothetical protein